MSKFTEEEMDARILKLNKLKHILHIGYEDKTDISVVKIQKNDMGDGANGIQAYHRGFVLEDLISEDNNGSWIMKSDIIMEGTFDEIVEKYPEKFI